MTPTEMVYANLQSRGIEVFSCPLHGRKSICSADGYIGINDALFESEADRFTDAIHNQGHFDAKAFYYPESKYQLRAKQEYLADKAAALKYVPPERLKEYMMKNLSIWEIADRFGITTEFLWRCFTIYTENMGLL